MGEHRFGSLRMMFGRPDAGAMGRAQHHRAAQPPLRAVAQPRGVIHQLIDAGIHEPHELYFADRAHALRRHPDAEAADQQFRERRVDHAIRPEPLLQAERRAKYAAVDADILAEHDDVGILLKSAGERQIDGFDERRLSHATLRSTLRAARHSSSAERHRDDRTWSRARAGGWRDSARRRRRPFADTLPRAAPPRALAHAWRPTR